jgi:hypothetical protein
MKKTISIYMIFGFLLTSFAGCGKLKSSPVSGLNQSDTSATPAQTPEPATPAQTPASYLTVSNWGHDGDWWMELDKFGQLYYSIGFSEGSDSIYYDLYLHIKSQEAKDLMEKFFNKKYTSNAKYRTIIDFINEFYSTSQYRTIPIHTALELFHLSNNGEITVREIDDFATEMLKFYAEIRQQ